MNGRYLSALSFNPGKVGFVGGSSVAGLPDRQWRLVALFPRKLPGGRRPIPVIRLVRRHARKLPLVHVPQTTCL